MKKILAALLLTASLCRPVFASDTGSDAPALDAKLFDGSNWSLAQQRGRVVLVNYWASWCGVCQQELPGFVRYYQTHHDEGFELLAINVDDADSFEAAQKMARGFPFAVTRAADIRTDGYAKGCQPAKGVLSLFSMCRLPHSYLIDRRGKLQLDVVAGIDEAKLDQVVGPLLKAPAE